MAALIIDSISWASIGITVVLHYGESRPARAAALPELSVAALLRHAPRHYILSPIIAKPLDRIPRSQRADQKGGNHEAPRSRSPHHHHAEPQAHPRLRRRRCHRRHHPCVDIEGG